MTLKDGAYTGNKDAGNPYQGDLGKGINFDQYEAESLLILRNGIRDEQVTEYQKNGKDIANHTPKGKRILEMGSGTGIATLEVLNTEKVKQIIGIEVSEGMNLVAQYKFHQVNGNELCANAYNKKENIGKHLEKDQRSIVRESPSYKMTLKKLILKRNHLMVHLLVSSCIGLI